jgi:hypothetical protein
VIRFFSIYKKRMGDDNSLLSTTIYGQLVVADIPAGFSGFSGEPTIPQYAYCQFDRNITVFGNCFVGGGINGVTRDATGNIAALAPVKFNAIHVEGEITMSDGQTLSSVLTSLGNAGSYDGRITYLEEEVTSISGRIAGINRFTDANNVVTNQIDDNVYILGDTTLETVYVNAGLISNSGITIGTINVADMLSAHDTDITLLLAATSTNGVSSLVSGNNSWTGTNTFNTNLPTSTRTPTSNTMLTTKVYVDSTISTALAGYSSSVLLGTANVWGNINAFNTHLPTSTATPSINTELTTKVYVDGAISTAVSTKTTLAEIRAAANTWTNVNTFNTLPVSTVTPTISSQFVTKSYTDGAISTAVADKTTLATVVGSNNTWTGSNSYSSLPSSTLSPTLGVQFTNKTYTDGAISTAVADKVTLAQVVAANNSWTGSNSYSSLPSCAATPTTSSQLTNKLYVDTGLALKTTLAEVRGSNNTFSGTNTFSAATTFSSASFTSASFSGAVSISSNISTTGKIIASNTNKAFGTDNFTSATLTGGTNIAIGGSACRDVTSGYFNIGLGENTLKENTTGYRNLGIGLNSLSKNTTGNFNIALGTDAGTSTGSITASLCSYIGYGTTNTGNFSNSTALGAQASITASNQIKLGTSSETVKIPGPLSLDGSLSIATSTNHNIQIGGSVTLSASGTINGSYSTQNYVIWVTTNNITITLGSGFTTGSIIHIINTAGYTHTVARGSTFTTLFDSDNNNYASIPIFGNRSNFAVVSSTVVARI